MRNIRFILFAMALCVLCSCSDRGDDVSAGGRYPILFGSTETRGVADLDSLKTNGFKVYAYFQGNTGNTGVFERNMTEYDSDNNVWKYDGVQYWIPGTAYWFKAFYPTTLTAGTLTVDNTTSAQNFTITDFDITQQVDVMVSDQEIPSGVNNAGEPSWPGESNSNGSVVSFSFNHLLACVVIKIQSQISGVKVTDISLGTIQSGGSYNSTDGKWTYEGTATINRNKLGFDIIVSSNEYTDVTDGGILVLPQTVANQNIKLTITATGAPKESYEVYIPATEWIMGNKYTYTMTIKQGYIVFNEPTVEQWDEENATGSVIIK